MVEHADGIFWDLVGLTSEGMATVLTGQEITEGDFVGGDGRRAGWGGGISLDQHIVNMLQPNTPLGSLEPAYG